MNSIERNPVSITEDRALRADYAWDTKRAAGVIGWHPNRFGSWWYGTRRKLTQLARSDPSAFHIEMARILNDAQRRG